MQLTILQNVFLVFELILAIGCLLYIMSLTLSLWKGAPFVPSKSNDVDRALKDAELKAGQKFLELGCGDGRVVCKGVKEYGVLGRGVDISPLWLFGARLRARLIGIHTKVEFKVEDILRTDIAWADIVYLYMMPRFLGNHAAHIFAKCKPGTLVISYVFDIPHLKDHLTKTDSQGRYYIYKI